MAIRPATIVCPLCDGQPSCELCKGKGQYRGEMIRLLPNKNKTTKFSGGRKFTSADDIARKMAKDRDGWTCRRCGKTKDVAQIHASHIWASTYKRLRKGFARHTGYACCLRHDPANMLSLCAGDHLFWAHRNPHDFVKFVIQEIGQDAYDDLEAQAKQKMQPGELLRLREQA